VASIGPGDAGTLSYTGTRFAVAFAAGQAALVRAAYPELTAVQAEQRIQQTADGLGAGKPNDRYGYGIIDPAASVAQSTSDGNPSASAPDSGGGAALPVFLGIALLAGGAVIVILLFRRRARE
jgi:subtilisin family serine protease